MHSHLPEHRFRRVLPRGLPFGLELSAHPWKDGDLLSWAYAYDRDCQPGFYW
jgi:Asp-tRNA(Asn)/Glu-tRNA(Gln) amidotransferase A subunit family amidase